MKLPSCTSAEVKVKKEEPMADWSDLPNDVLTQLTSFLPLPEYHRFSSVCWNWNIAEKERCPSPAKQLPWMLVRGEKDPQKRRAFSISDNRHYSIDFSDLEGQYMCGSSYGWLFTMDRDLNFRLLNPLTGKHYNLPRVPPYGADRGMTWEVYKAITDHDPSQRSDFTVLNLYGAAKRAIAFWRPGDLVWTVVECDFFLFDDITFFKGNFYANDHMCIDNVLTCVTYLVDVGPDPKFTRVAPDVPQYGESRTYLVDFRDELLLLQMWRTDIGKDHLLTRAFLVYKLDMEEGKYHRRDHLNDCSIFLGCSSSLVVDRGQFSRCNENCIYFTAHVDCNREEYGRDDNGIYNMVKGTVTPYYPPEIYHPEIEGPIWWTPNPS